jgi:hypothetical protein
MSGFAMHWSALSGCYAAFRREHDRLEPIQLTAPDLFDDDLVTIPEIPREDQ